MEGLASDPLVWRVAGLLAFNIVDASSWEWYHYAEWVALLWLALDILARLVLGVGSAVGAGDPKVAIKDGGKRLLAFEAIDKTYITINKLMTGLFTYHAIRYCWNSELISWGWPAAAVVNTPTSPAGSSGLVATVADATAKLLAAGLPGVFVLAVVQLALLYFVYDFGYTLFHWALHHPSVYSYVHKHHHRQVVPFRGNLDAINVHPFEFFVGEYNHLFATHVVSIFVNYITGGVLQVHVGAMWLFIIAGGVLASLNHTRFAASLPLGLFQVAYHDVHHHLFAYNYGQYSMVWDRIFGTFKAHPHYDSLSGSRIATAPSSSPAAAGVPAGKATKAA